MGIRASWWVRFSLQTESERLGGRLGGGRIRDCLWRAMLKGRGRERGCELGCGFAHERDVSDLLASEARRFGVPSAAQRESRPRLRGFPSRIRDIFGDEDSGSNHFLPFQDGEQALRAVTFSDSHKRPRHNVVNDVKTSIYHEDPTNVASLPIIDGRLLPSALQEGSSNMLDLSWSSLSGKTAQALGLTKCSTGSSFLDCQGARISTSSFGEDLNGTGNATLCSDYLLPGKMGVVQHNKHDDISSGNVFASVWTKEQRDGEDDLQSYGCPNIGNFEDFDRMFRNLGSTFPHGSIFTEEEITWFLSTSHGFHGMEDTLQSVVLSSVSESSAFNNTSTSHDLFVNNLLAIEPSANNTEIPSGTHCSPLPMYSDTERKGKSVLSDQAYVHAGILEKSLAPEHIGYGNECRDPGMINMTLKELCPATGKKVNSTLGSTVRSSVCGCGFIQNVQNQELLSSFVPATQPYSLQAIPKQNLFSEPHASNCLQSYNPPAQMSDILKLQPVCPTLNSSVIDSSALLDYETQNNSSSLARQFIGILPGPFPMPSMPVEKNDKIYAQQKIAAALVMDKRADEHAAASDSSVQRKYKFEDEAEGDKKTVYASGNLPAVTIGSSSLQDNSCMTSTFLNDVSLKAANVRQLQIITDRLGVRTKLCIRDSLYRLARSAEQSHYYGTADNISSGSSPMIGLQGGKYSKRPPDIFSTNAIARSVAYLLFHKSLESGTGTADDSLWIKSPTQIHGPVGNREAPDLPAL